MGVGHGPTPGVSLGVGVGELFSNSSELDSIGRLTPFSAPLSLDFAVNQYTRNKIWGNEYVEFASLLDPTNASQNKIMLQKTETGIIHCV